MLRHGRLSYASRLRVMDLLAAYSPILLGTVMVATVALGLVVDDTCHFLVRLRAFVRGGMDLPDAIALTMDQTGRPIISTGLILAAGFSILLWGTFTPTWCFGLVSAFVILVALAADLLVLPAALLVLRPKP